MRKLLITKVVPEGERFTESAVEPIMHGKHMYGVAVFTREKIERNGFVFDYGIKSQVNSYFLDKPIVRKTLQARAFEELSTMLIKNIENQL